MFLDLTHVLMRFRREQVLSKRLGLQLEVISQRYKPGYGRDGSGVLDK